MVAGRKEIRMEFSTRSPKYRYYWHFCRNWGVQRYTSAVCIK